MDANSAWTLQLAHLDRRLATIDRRLARLARTSGSLSRFRVAVFVATLVLALVVGIASEGPGEWVVIAAGAVVFTALVGAHARIERARERWRTWRALQKMRIARLTLDWDALPRVRRPAVDAGHPFAHDLDLVGRRSLLRLLDTTISNGGRRRLLRWLLVREPDVPTILQRQRRVRALTGRRHFRDRLALAALQALGARRESLDTRHLLRWIGQERDTGGLRRTTGILGAMAALNLALILGSSTAGWPAWWGFTVPLYFLGYVVFVRRIAHLFDEAGHLEEALAPLHAAFAALERGRVPAEIEVVVAPLRKQDAHRPSRILREVRWIVWASSIRTNALLWLFFNVALPWDLLAALRLERMRHELRIHLPHWLDAWHELEALGALADFAELTPCSTTPVFDEHGPVLEARALGHPLVRADQRVTNDFTVDALGRVVIVTGSNMSGKSTFLRTVGVNVALANAGGVVVAGHFRLRPLRLFTCIQVVDSVNDGISYFYAEVRRLGALLRSLESASPYAQLSIVDEIFRGTNNRERWIGSRCFVEHQVGQRGVLLLSTHDLELAALADTRPETVNLHFREEIDGSAMVFDYRLREGACPTTNALVLMRQEGLPVPNVDERTREQ